MKNFLKKFLKILNELKHLSNCRKRKKIKILWVVVSENELDQYIKKWKKLENIRLKNPVFNKNHINIVE